MEFIEITHHGKRHRLDHNKPIRLSSTLRFNTRQRGFYGVAPASATPLRYGNTLARISKGGTCNASQISFVPHCHGTHTECIGHLLPVEKQVAELAFEPFIATSLIRVPLVRYADSAESYNTSSFGGDLVITRKMIDLALQRVSHHYLDALVIATEGGAANDLPPYFSHEAMARLASLDIAHLLVDIPSIDRAYDDGKLDNHRIFWGLFEANRVDVSRAQCSLTEMATIPPETKEGHYFLIMHLPDIMGDALPSKPVLFSFSCTGE